MLPSFYSSEEYKRKQSEISKENWKKGRMNSLIKREVRFCKRPGCKNSFYTILSNPKIYCSRSCSAIVRNTGRIVSPATKEKISKWMNAHPDHSQGLKLPKVKLVCQNSNCRKSFEVFPYQIKTRKYCTALCAIQIIGRRTTSPKAAKSKPGIRSDIDPTICFYSTWEANVARVFNVVKLRWQYAPKIFDLGQHTYRPDFYLPKYDTFIEVKNFMGEYSLERDRLFRQRFPNLKLELILKIHYKLIEKNYRDLIANWES